MALKSLDWWLQAIRIQLLLVLHKLLKQLYCDAGCFPNNLTQSVYKSVFQSVLPFSHVHAQSAMYSTA